MTAPQAVLSGLVASACVPASLQASTRGVQYTWHREFGSRRRLHPARAQRLRVQAALAVAAASEPATKLLASSQDLLQSSSQQLQAGVQSAASSLQVPADIDVEQAAQVAAQAAGAAAEGAAQLVRSALAPLDVFGGAWLLDVMFWGILGVTAYSLILLAPRQ